MKAKRISVGGFTAAGMLVVAVLGGAVGGAVAMSGGSGPAPVAPVAIHQVAEDTTTPTVQPTLAPEPSPAPVVHEDPAPVSDPEPKVAPVAPKTETASEAADRAKAEADRAKAEADRAAKVVTPDPDLEAGHGVRDDGGATSGSGETTKVVVPEAGGHGQS